MKYQNVPFRDLWLSIFLLLANMCHNGTSRSRSKVIYLNFEKKCCVFLSYKGTDDNDLLRCIFFSFFFLVPVVLKIMEPWPLGFNMCLYYILVFNILCLYWCTGKGCSDPLNKESMNLFWSSSILIFNIFNSRRMMFVCDILSGIV